jgi:hypothetical protein
MSQLTSPAADSADRHGRLQIRLRGATMMRRSMTALVVLAMAGVGGVAAAGPAAAAGAPVLAFSPAPFGYGKVTTGQTASQVFTLANTGGSASGRLTVTMAGSAWFTIAADACTGASLKPGQSCAVTVQFAPTIEATGTATVTASTKGTVLATDAVTGTGVGHLYWTNPDTGTIGGANLDGTGVNQNFITGASGPGGVAVDASHVYWANANSGFPFGTIGRANLDGTGVNQNFVTGASEPAWLAVNVSHIYWSNPGTDHIEEANLDGTGLNPNFIACADACEGVAVDASHIYWANNNSIGEANLDGTGVNQNFIVPGAACQCATGPEGVAVTASNIYWTNLHTGTIGEANLNGTGVNSFFISGASYPFGIAVDASTLDPSHNHIYWSNSGTSTIGEANLNGTGVNQNFITGVFADGVAVSPAILGFIVPGQSS